MPRVRFTVRRMMVAVAVAALTLGVIVGLQNRHQRFRRIAEDHRSRMIAWEEVGRSEATRKRFDLSGQQVSLAAHHWHLQMAENYEHAARRPWLPVAPDPPEPAR